MKTAGVPQFDSPVYPVKFTLIDIKGISVIHPPGIGHGDANEVESPVAYPFEFILVECSGKQLPLLRSLSEESEKIETVPAGTCIHH
jgi:hypothetical protein